ncbi:MAG: hypothetical protein K5793_00450 [Nitrosarchaeum sp.]|nr:hypothetical protein [Nitrosarchaeum sp.]
MAKAIFCATKSLTANKRFRPTIEMETSGKCLHILITRSSRCTNIPIKVKSEIKVNQDSDLCPIS